VYVIAQFQSNVYSQYVMVEKKPGKNIVPKNNIQNEKATFSVIIQTDIFILLLYAFE